MGPKVGKRKSVKAEYEPVASLEVVEEALVVAKAFDPFEELRYTPLQRTHRPTKQAAQVKTVPVMKRAKLSPMLTPLAEDIATTDESSFKSRPWAQNEIHSPRRSAHFMKKYEKVKYQLEMDVIYAPPLTRWVAPSELPLLPPPIEVLKRRKPLAPSVRQQMQQRSHIERRHLDHYVEVKQQQIVMENYLMRSTGKSRSNLLIRRKQLLPKIGPGGLEQNLIRLEKAEPPVVETSKTLFSMAEHMKQEKNGICPRMTKKQQGYSVVSEWVGCPEVTDVIMQNLGLVQEEDVQEEEFDFSQSHAESGFGPLIERLGLIGNQKPCAKKSNSTLPKTRFTVQTPKQTKSQEVWSGKKSGRHLSTAQAALAERLSTFSCNMFGSTVGLILGDTFLSWSADAESSLKTWVIELGCTADLEKNEICSINMTNMGTTAINYQWVRKDHADAFDLSKYRLTRFILDSDNKVILPGETFRIPLLYKSFEPGYYTEDWRLLTKPVLENGAVIILRLWGVTRSFDRFLHERERLEASLTRRETKATVQDRVDRIIRFLPLKEMSAKDKRTKLVLEGPDLFQFHNPWLHYRTAEVFRLGKLLEMLENRQAKLVTPKKSAVRSESVVDSVLNLAIASPLPEALVAANEISKEIEDGDEEDGEEVTATDAGSENLSDSSSTNIPDLNGKKYTVEAWQAVLLKKINNEMKIKDYVLEVDVGEDQKKLFPLSTLNVANCDFSVETLQNKVLDEIDVLEEQEAYCMVMASQISRLCFRTDYAEANVKQSVALTLLMKTIDQFCEYALDVKIKCCETMMRKSMEKADKLLIDDASAPELVSNSATENQQEAELQKPPPPAPVIDNTISNMSQTVADDAASETMEENNNNAQCEEDFTPRTDMDPRSYKGQYYDRLYIKMYQLLSEYFDTLDLLLSHMESAKELRGKPEAIEPGIQRVKTTQFGIHRTENLLSAPLPPSWVRLAQRIDLASNVYHARDSGSQHKKISHVSENSLRR
ncbi:hypothetical protein Btru_009011 [Bulinus truncatus]|nr:hypothetical protein Btru_009011 [Bulinus truncatus]